MEAKKKYYVSACSSGHGRWLENLGYDHTTNIEESDVVIFGGGADIEPETYNEEPGTQTYTSAGREKLERQDFQKALSLGKKMFGICRGHQLLCALAGGKLIQHVEGHSGDHDVTTLDNFTFRTNSIHHQMINPYVLPAKDYKILAWSTKKLSKVYLGAKDKRVWLPVDFKEIEAIYFPNIAAVGVQYHPEMMYGNYHDGILNWTRKIFMKFMDNEL
jgi:putative glutamine amidotransferase